MNTLLRSLALLSLLTSCAGEVVCVEYVWCCSYTCTSEQEAEERGSDPCKCSSEPEAPEGTCMDMDGVCDWH